MKDQFKIALVSGDATFKEVKQIITESNLKAELVHFESFKNLSNSAQQFEVVVVALISLNRGREILSDYKEDIRQSPLVFLYPDDLLSLTDYKDLIINGAFGLVPESNIKSLIQHIIRLKDSTIHREHDSVMLDELFESYFNTSDSLFSIINSDLKYELANESFSKFHNLDNKDLRGLCPSEIWGEDAFSSSIKDNIVKCLNGEVIKYKAYFDRDDSAGRCYEVIYRPLNPKGRNRSFSLVETKDITEVENSNKFADESLRRNIFYESYLPFGIFECNREGDILNANETFYNILEIPSDDRQEVNLKMYSGGELRFTGYLEVVKEGESSTFSQLQMVTSKGTEIFTRISSHSRSDSAGNLVINATLEDNTREILLEKKLNQSHRIETLGTLAGGIAHDFNTILTTIAGYSEMAMDEVDKNSKIYDYMTRLSNSVLRAESIVNQMLTFSRQIEVEMVPVKVESVVSEVCDFMESALPLNIKLNREINKIEGFAEADPTQLFRVFLNIMTNAMQAMEEMGGNLDIKVSGNMSGKKGYANVTISDSGKGIDKAIIDRIYEPFFTTKDTGEGTGMGLAVAHGIISRIGGEISVESLSGEGATFRVNIPIFSQLEGSGTDKIKESVNKTILYIDNNIHFSRTVSLALEKLGYRVNLVSSKIDFDLQLTEKMEIDFVFIRCTFDKDVKLLMINKVVETYPDSKIILITAPGATSFREVLKTDRERISILNEPVTLREIVNSLFDN